MRRLISWILIMLVVLIMASSCDIKNISTEQTTMKSTISLHQWAKDYKIIIPSSASSELQSVAERFQSRFADLTNIMLEICMDSDCMNVADGKEILIGYTNRVISSQTYNEFNNIGFAVRKDGNTIVIIGYNTPQTLLAVDYYIDNYIATEKNMDEKFSITITDNSLIPLYFNNIKNVRIVYPNGDMDAYKYATEISAKIESITMDEINAESDINSKMNTDVNIVEVLVGNTSYDETATMKATLTVNDYGVRIINGKIVVLGLYSNTLSMATSLLCSAIQNGTITSYDKKTSIVISSEIYAIQKDTNTFIPPDVSGAELITYNNCGDNNFLLLYNNATKNIYDDYCKKLTDDNYLLYMENIIGNNIYRTYTNSTTFIHTYYIDNTNTIRIVAGQTSNHLLIPTGAQSYEKITDSTLTWIGLRYDNKQTLGMGCIFTLEDGSYLIYDGGMQNCDDVYNYLAQNNKRADGKIIIAAWVITHSHVDHYGTFNDFSSKYAKSVTLEYVYATGASTLAFTEKGMKDYNTYCISTIKSAVQKFAGAKYVQPHTGQTVTIRNAKIDFIYTYEDLYPTLVDWLNNASTVSIVTINNQRIYMAADTEMSANNTICKMYSGNDLKCDILQVNHHGHNGGTEELYKLILPICTLWSCSDNDYEARKNWSIANGNGSDNAYLTYLGADVITCSNGFKTICLPYSKGKGYEITYSYN